MQAQNLEDFLMDDGTENAPLVGKTGGKDDGMGDTQFIIIGVVCAIVVIAAVAGTVFVVRLHN